jgi:hypothetical protein
MKKIALLLIVMISFSCKKEENEMNNKKVKLIYNDIAYIDSINIDKFIDFKDVKFSNNILDYNIFNTQKVLKINNNQLSKLGASCFSNEDTYKKYYYGKIKINNWNVYLISEEETIIIDNKNDSINNVQLAYLLFEKSNKYKYILKVATTKIDPESIIHSVIKNNYIITEEMMIPSYDIELSKSEEINYFQVIKINENSIEKLNKIKSTEIYRNLMRKN